MTTATTMPAKITPEDLLRMEDNNTLELVDGHIVAKNVSIESSRIESKINQLLRNEAERTGDAAVYGSSLGYQCFPEDPGRIRKPDVSLVRRERLAQIKGDRGFMPIAPDLAVEVISPNDVSYEITRKIEEYLSARFSLIWIVDPPTRTVTIHRADGSVTKLHENGEITGETALPEFRCRVGEFFAQ
jgi:Uma2 family endonuclease